MIATLDADAATYRGLGVDPARIRVVGLFTAAPPADLDPSGLRRSDDELVVFLGGRYRHKGVDVLLEAIPARVAAATAGAVRLRRPRPRGCRRGRA